MASSISAGTTSSTALVATADTSGSLVLQTNNGTVAVTVDTSQNVGIGTSSPSSYGKLTVNDAGAKSVYVRSSSTNFSGLLLENTNSVTKWQIGVEGGTYNTAGLLNIGIDGVGSKMAIDSSGNVGIGTTSPSGKLHVTAAAGTETNFYLGNQTSGARTNIRVQSASNNDGYIFFERSGASENGYIRYSQSSDFMAFQTASAERMRIDSSGNVGIGGSPVSALYVARSAAQAATNTLAFTTTRPGTADSLEAYWSDSYSPNGAAATLKLGSMSATGRSINASGTINASGSDYAEYMTKSSDFTVAKGDVVGIDGNGKLTNVFADAVSFVVKSTAPSFVGGDVWGTDDSLGLSRPTQPTQRTATEEVEAETDEEFAIRQAAYKTEKAVFEAALEAARQLVDRVAFSGQVPVNVMGATAGQYIVPVDDNGAIKGEAVSSPTFEQYQQAVGKVIAIEQDGRARIIVKVA